jgi:hypothetical protein
MLLLLSGKRWCVQCSKAGATSSAATTATCFFCLDPLSPPASGSRASANSPASRPAQHSKGKSGDGAPPTGRFVHGEPETAPDDDATPHTTHTRRDATIWTTDLLPGRASGPGPGGRWCI